MSRRNLRNRTFVNLGFHPVFVELSMQQQDGRTYGVLNRIIGAFLLAAFLNVSLVLPGLAEGEDDPLWNRPSFEKKVFNIGQRILAANGIKERFTFRVLQKGEENAYANRWHTPNTVVVFKGMMDYISSDDELAAILSHEIAHISMRHHRRTLTKTIPIAILTGVGAVALALATGGIGAIAAAAAPALTAPIIRKYEKEADLVGLEYMVNAGYNPLAMETIMTKITADAGAFTTFMADHPIGDKRLDYIHEKIVASYPQFLTPEMATAVPGSPYAIQPHVKGEIPTKIPDKGMAYIDPADETETAAAETTAETAEIFEPPVDPETQKLYDQLAAIAAGKGPATEPEAEETTEAEESAAEAASVETASTAEIATKPKATESAEARPDTDLTLPAPKKIDYSQTGAVTKPPPKKITYNFGTSPAASPATAKPAGVTKPGSAGPADDDLTVAETLLTLDANGLLLIKTLKQQEYMEFREARELLSMEGEALQALIHQLWEKRLIRPLGSGSNQVIVLTDRTAQALGGE